VNDEDRQQNREAYRANKRASEDLADILSLRTNPATERYLLRRAREISQQHAATVLDGENLDATEREILRRLYKAFNEFTRILDIEEAAHRATLETLP
jgi:hypothetical protein